MRRAADNLSFHWRRTLNLNQLPRTTPRRRLDLQHLIPPLSVESRDNLRPRWLVAWKADSLRSIIHPHDETFCNPDDQRWPTVANGSIIVDLRHLLWIGFLKQRLIVSPTLRCGQMTLSYHIMQQDLCHAV
jgi:hypothetical protein